MNLTRPASKSFRVIGCLMLLVYGFALPGIVPVALGGLAAAGDHDHEVQFAEHGGKVALVLHHHEVSDARSSAIHHHDEQAPHEDMLSSDADHGHGDHVIHFSSSSDARLAATAKQGTLPVSKLAPSWGEAHFATVRPLELRCAATWARPPPGGTARMTCLRTTVLLV